MELGEELNRFLAVLKELSGDDYGLVLKKSLLKQSDWATTRIVLNRRNNWDDQKEILVSANTSTDESLLKYDGKIEDIPEMGKIIGEIKQGDSIFIKGIFPIYDVSKHKVGGVFVLHNITDIYMGMKASQRSTIIFIIFQAIVICIILVIILFQLVFKRLASMMDKATRVVGGDYYTKIVPKSNDEVGQFESLFDQFRAVFVDMLEQLQSKEKISNDKI